MWVPSGSWNLKQNLGQNVSVVPSISVGAVVAAPSRDCFYTLTTAFIGRLLHHRKSQHDGWHTAKEEFIARWCSRFQRASGGFGSLIINPRSVIPIPFDNPVGDIIILIGNWYIRNHTALRHTLDAGRDLGMPDGVLINGKGPYRYNNTLVKDGIDHETKNVEQGRQNLIGVHIHYEGYSVLPMAIGQDTIVAIQKHDAGESEKLLRIANVIDKYTMCTYPVYPNQEIDLSSRIIDGDIMLFVGIRASKNMLNQLIFRFLEAVSSISIGAVVAAPSRDCFYTLTTAFTGRLLHHRKSQHDVS
ncbi:hypothetical protein L2E82_39291 [Cichorium intybus]|uniref:Uncharacterized protein n=1 Tax=Cichorium intybus TaxID=13427 RepID=A0ACB9AH34_CICIN|nr:hypothetical protein L2E82_39291 [Cichorium intybus]